MVPSNNEIGGSILEDLPQPDVVTAYHGSDAALTRRVLKGLESCGHHGRIAAALFRVQKSSHRAKRYRGGSKNRAYDAKDKSIQSLCALLSDQIAVNWGWRKDDAAKHGPENVLYVDLPTGQVSFHNYTIHGEKSYGKDWDGTTLSASRILEFCSHIKPSYHDTLSALSLKWYLNDISEMAEAEKRHESMYKRYYDHIVYVEKRRVKETLKIQSLVAREKAKSRPSSKFIKRWSERFDALKAGGMGWT